MPSMVRYGIVLTLYLYTTSNQYHPTSYSILPILPSHVPTYLFPTQHLTILTYNYYSTPKPIPHYIYAIAFIFDQSNHQLNKLESTNSNNIKPQIPQTKITNNIYNNNKIYHMWYICIYIIYSLIHNFLTRNGYTPFITPFISKYTQ